MSRWNCLGLLVSWELNLCLFNGQQSRSNLRVPHETCVRLSLTSLLITAAGTGHCSPKATCGQGNRGLLHRRSENKRVLATYSSMGEKSTISCSFNWEVGKTGETAPDPGGERHTRPKAASERDRTPDYKKATCFGASWGSLSVDCKWEEVVELTLMSLGVATVLSLFPGDACWRRWFCSLLWKAKGKCVCVTEGEGASVTAWKVG